MNSLFLLFISCLSLSALPGPNNILCFSHAVASGKTKAIIGMFGRFPAYFIMILIAAILSKFMIDLNKNMLKLLQIVGCFYMFYLGAIVFHSKSSDIKIDNKTSYDYFKRELLTALSNPKAILVFTALFPNYLTSSDFILWQFFIFGCLAMLAELIMAITYIFIGSQIGTRFISIKIINTICGLIIISISAHILFNVIF